MKISNSLPTSNAMSALLARAVREHADACAVVYRNQPTSYLMLAVAAYKLEQRFAAQGIGMGTRVGITLAPSPVFLSTLFALGNLGACAVPLSASRPFEQRLALARKFGIQALVVDDAAQALVGWPLIQVGNVGVGLDDIEAVRRAAASEPSPDRANMPWFVVLSSGTTNDPKGVALTQAQAWARIRQSTLPWDAATRTLPYEMSIGAGLFPALRTLAYGGTIIVTEDQDFAAGFSAFVAHHQGTHVSLSPWMAAQLARQLEGRTLAMPTVRCLWIAGGHCSHEVLRALLERATPHVWVKYASVETGVVASVHASEALSTPGLSGRLGDWVEARVLSDDGQDLGPGMSGILGFRSDGWPTAYLVEQDNADKAFADGWYISKDYGSVDLDRKVFVEGRAEGALNLAGMRMQPETIEQVLAEKLGLLECAVFTLPQANGDDHLAVAITPGDAAKTSAIEALLPGLLGPAQGVPIRVVTVTAIPRAGMGKIARRQLKLQFSKQA